MQEQEPNEFMASSGGSNVLWTTVLRRHIELHSLLNAQNDISYVDVDCHASMALTTHSLLKAIQ
jgi:hypothetical protein